MTQNHHETGLYFSQLQPHPGGLQFGICEFAWRLVNKNSIQNAAAHWWVYMKWLAQLKGT